MVGGGGAGLAAAVAAAQQGASVIVVEKLAEVGGDTLVCGAIYNTPDEELQKQVTMTEAVKTTVEAALAAGAVPHAPLPEAAVVPDGTGEHRADVGYEEPAVDADGYLVVDDGPAPAGSTAV